MKILFHGKERNPLFGMFTLKTLIRRRVFCRDSIVNLSVVFLFVWLQRRLQFLLPFLVLWLLRDNWRLSRVWFLNFSKKLPRFLQCPSGGRFVEFLYGRQKVLQDPSRQESGRVFLWVLKVFLRRLLSRLFHLFLGWGRMDLDNFFSSRQLWVRLLE